MLINLVSQLSDGVTFAQESDLSLLEWSGFMANVARENVSTQRNQKCLYDLLIDAHPSNQNTVLTTLVNI